MANSFEDVLNTLRELSTNKREQGRRFECLMQSFLQEDPEYKNLFSDVWLWEQWPDRNGPDTGIDLVAREKETGHFWAIQCKFYKKEHSLAKSDIDSFLAASGTKQFHYRMIISTTDKWTDNLRREVENQKTPCRIFTISNSGETGYCVARPGKKPNNDQNQCAQKTMEAPRGCH